MAWCLVKAQGLLYLYLYLTALGYIGLRSLVEIFYVQYKDMQIFEICPEMCKYIHIYICLLYSCAFMTIKEEHSVIIAVLPLTEHQAMKTYWGVEVHLHPSFDLGTRRR
jgi:hypothetical protein